MSDQDFYEVEPTEEKAAPSEEKKDKKENSEEYEQICYMCRRPESVAGKMIKIPQNIYICQDCMQKTFDTMNHSGFPMDDMLGGMGGKFPNISMINLSDLQGMGMMQGSQKVKKKKKDAKAKPIIDIQDIPSPNKIKAKLDDYVVGQ